jgi:hypothetical protein
MQPPLARFTLDAKLGRANIFIGARQASRCNGRLITFIRKQANWPIAKSAERNSRKILDNPLQPGPNLAQF